jgi:hypothetical protein
LAGAEEPLDVLVGEVTVPSRNANDELRLGSARLRLAGRLRRRHAVRAEHDLADDPLDAAAIEAGGQGERGSV